MNIKYIQYEDKYYDDLKNITLTSFKLTSFNTDKRILPDKANSIIWELWCKPVLVSDKKKYCIIALKKNKAAGYIIYGADAAYSKILNRKMGSIILMAVDSKFQNKYNIASGLLNQALDIYSRYGMNIISAGTDTDNFPAITNYIKTGFRPVLFWSTYRYYFEDNTIDNYKDIRIVQKNKIKISDLKDFTQPVPLLSDKRIQAPLKRKIETYILKKIQSLIANEKLKLFELMHKGKCSAFFTLLQEKTISKILGRDLYRINNIIFLEKEMELNKRIIKSFLHYLKEKDNNISIMEIFVRSNDWNTIEALTGSGFILVHNAVTLHKFI